ncbi:MFS transporter [Candidatus Paracaedibacter symbiosus]|uniref:MFS transporter n=1 Tax=Candidatus Paracaedibacter symbiosus TaxID=244582 RepID=UPI000AD910F1|nr:MFS transporter [Candidatus Paracaedibacter symbiosus]
MEKTDGLPLIDRRWAMLTIALAITMSTLDSTIANVALPTIARDLNSTPNSSIWVINAYQLTLSICLLPLSSLGDIVGYRKVYCAGLAIFSAASLACAISSSLPALTLARVLQGIGAAGILSVNAAIIRLIYPKKELGRGIGLNAFIVAVSAALGPTIAAGILAIGTWEWLFAINVPIGLVALRIATTHLPDSHNGYTFDWANAVLCAMTISILIISIDGVGHQGKLIQVASGLLFAFGMGVVLIRRELTVEAPLFPVDLFKIPLFASSIATSICSFIAQMAAFTSLPFFMQYVLLRNEVQTGLLMTPWPIATAITAPLAGRLADRYSVGVLGGIGLLIFSAGLYLLAGLSADATDASIMWRMSICGAGFGLFQSPNNRAILGSAPDNRSGSASGMLGTARLLGQTVGAALVSLVFGLVAAGPTRIVLYGAAILSIVAACVSMIRIGPRYRLSNE